jgi:hypothetical protein
VCRALDGRRAREHESSHAYLTPHGVGVLLPPTGIEVSQKVRRSGVARGGTESPGRRDAASVTDMAKTPFCQGDVRRPR